MKTTFNIDDRLMRALKREAAKRGCTVSELVEAGIRLAVKNKKALPAKEIPPLPKFSMGGALVDYADREALYRAMEEEDDDWAALYRVKERK
jgi:hypothetical protein